MKKKVTVRVPRIIIVIVAFLFAAIIAKISYVVLSEKVDGINLQAKAASIATVERTLYAKRGNIYDVNGDTLAETVNSYTLVAFLSSSRTTNPDNPKHVVDKEMTAKKLSEVINMTEENILARIKKDKYQVELVRGITELDKANIEALDLPGIGFISTSKKRYYSKGTFASYIIGYAKEYTDEFGESKLVGELGIEGYYDDYYDFNEILSGTNGYTKYLKYTANNYQIPNTPEETKAAVDGADIYLTIDSYIQQFAEKAVKTIKEKYNSTWAIFVVMDANTGAIVASATNPNFDPNNTNTITDYKNPLVSTTYEPGSVMKIFSFASAIEEGKYKGDELYKSGSYILKDGTKINDSNRKGWGTITFDDGFAHSSNVAATTLALRLGSASITDYYTKLGFGKQKVGIELANEYMGDIGIQAESELATASFGQGISVTPIQMLQALSSMTNDGSTIRPYIVDKIVDSNGEIIYQGKRTVVEKVYSTATVNKMHELMYGVVKLNTFWQPGNVSIMGKTGTAQIPSKGGYLNGPYDYVRSFAGFFPKDDPKYIVYAVVEKAETTQKGWSNVVTTAVEEIASYAKIADTISDVDNSKLINLNNFISKEVEGTVTALKEKNVNPIVLGNGKYIINQYPLKNTSILAGNKVFLLTNATEFRMLDLTGWSLNDVSSYCQMIGLKFDYTGYGYVKNQSIPKDTVIDLNTMTLTIEFDK